MESPDRSESIPPPVDQGSPFFKYLCGLSPIKPARSVHVVQTYAELSLPPPPTVFTSPPNLKCGRRVKRGLVISSSASTHLTVQTVGHLGSDWGVDKQNHLNHSYELNSYAAAQSDPALASPQVGQYHQYQPVRVKLEKEEAAEETGTTDDRPPKFEFGDVADYLADPPDGGSYAAASGSKSVTKSYVLSLSPACHCSVDDNNSVANHEDSLSSEYQDRAHSSEDATKGKSVNQVQLTDFRREERTEPVLSGAGGSSSDHENSSRSNAFENTLEVDQETAAMAFLLVGDPDTEEGSRNDWQAATDSVLPNFPSQQPPDFLAMGKLSSLAQRLEVDFELAASESDVGTANVDSKDMEIENSKDILVSGSLGQRGIRRRCLDFETTARRKSMGGVGPRKNLAVRSKHPHGSSAVTSAIPPSVLCERAVATSDATNSATGSAAASDVQSDESLRPESRFSENNSPRLLRVARCSFQRTTHAIATDQGSTQLSRQLVESGNPSSALGIPSGIGLHLNSLSGSMSFSPTNKGSKQPLGTGTSSSSLLGIPVFSGTSNGSLSDKFGSCTPGTRTGSRNFAMSSTTSNFATGVVLSVVERSQMSVREPLPITDMARSIVKLDTSHSLSVEDGQSIEESGSSLKTLLDATSGTVGKKRLQHQDMLQQPNIDLADEYDNSPRSPKKKRKSLTATGEKPGDGCKRCNCKKSKCLKLYCECFAAGTYCVGACTCHDCFNKPEHEEMVLSTRQQIESRNPLAFAPKIIHSGDASPKQGEEILETPASARHKRGCNCKKSLCLKKYCECYQAGVGCSEGCRCEGCKNMFGRKEVPEDYEGKGTASDALEVGGSLEDEVDLRKPGFQVRPEKIDRKDLSPITPSFEYTGQGRTTGRIRSGVKRRSSSPLSQSYPGPNPTASPVNTPGSSLIPQFKSDAQRSPDLQRLRSANSPLSTPKFSRMSQLSPRWDGLGDICTLTPLPQPPLRPTPASVSTIEKAGGCPSFSPHGMELMSSYQPDNLDNNFLQPLDHSPSSEGRKSLTRSSSTPGTPRVSSTTLKDNMKGDDATSGHLVSFQSEDDETPDFLKYPETMNSPFMTKTSSPKQKRVCPPHCEGMRDANRGNGRATFDSPARSSPGLRTGRKFILQALPSLPPIMAPAESSAKGKVQNSRELPTGKSIT